MNFFERQRQARSDSRRLLVLFGLTLLAIVLAVDTVVLLYLFAMNEDPSDPMWRWHEVVQHAPVLAGVAAVTLAAIAVTSLIRTAQLRAGGSAVARSLGGTEIPASSNDLKHQRLRNVVEEIAIASGVPIPQVFVLEQESAINAFAAGYGTTDAAVAVTRGALDKLDREQLQGVIAHEFSHVLNGDMRLNVRLIGWLAGITLLAIVGRILMRVRGRNTGAVVVFGIALFAIGSVGLIGARVIKASIARKREYLADASAVQFTRQTDGLAGALKAIAADSQGSTLGAVDGEEVSHMLFGDGIGRTNLFATHPPLEARIRALEPGFKMADLDDWARTQASRLAARNRGDGGDQAQDRQDRRPALPDLDFGGVLGKAGAAIPLPVIIAGLSEQASVPTRPDRVVDQVGSPQPRDYRTADLLHATMPPLLDAAAHRPERAAEVLAGLLTSASHADARRVQAGQVEHWLGADSAAAALAFAEACTALHPMQRLPLAEIAFAALRRLPADQVRRCADLVEALVKADGQVSLFEFCLGHLLRQHIAEALEPASGRASGRRSLADARDEVGLLLSLLASEGHRERTAAERAFAAGAAELGHGIAPKFRVPADWPQRLAAALEALDGLKPMAKSLLVAAMTAAVMHDERLDVAEAELLRTACAALHCPLPPLLHASGTRLAGLPTVG
jgi:Zn-dependent protease with chaperone function